MQHVYTGVTVINHFEEFQSQLIHYGKCRLREESGARLARPRRHKQSTTADHPILSPHPAPYLWPTRWAPLSPTVPWGWWRMKTCSQPKSELLTLAARCPTTGGWRGCTAWTADTTSRSWPMGRCGASGMSGMITVSEAAAARCAFSIQVRPATWCLHFLWWCIKLQHGPQNQWSSEMIVIFSKVTSTQRYGGSCGFIQRWVQ